MQVTMVPTVGRISYPHSQTRTFEHSWDSLPRLQMLHCHTTPSRILTFETGLNSMTLSAGIVQTSFPPKSRAVRSCIGFALNLLMICYMGFRAPWTLREAQT